MREFSERRWDVARVPHATQVVEKAQSQLPNVIILDALMQGGGAVMPLSAMQNHPTLGRVPVVIINDDQGEVDEAFWLAHGAAVCVSRHSTPEQVASEVDKLLGNSVDKLALKLRMLGEEERFHKAMGGRVFSLQEDRFLGTLAHLATRLLTVPMVLLTPVDERFQFFASQQGFRDPATADARKLHVPYSFPRWLVRAGASMMVADVNNDALLGGSDTIAESGLAAYACVSVPGVGGTPFALIFAADTHPHEWTERDQEILEDFSNILAGHTARARLGFDRELARYPEHRLVAHALRSWGQGISSVGDMIWHADYRLTPDERRQLADYVQRMGDNAGGSSSRWV